MFKVFNICTENTVLALCCNRAESSAHRCEKLLRTELRVPSVEECCNYYAMPCWRRKCGRPRIWYRQGTRDGVAVTAYGDKNATLFIE